MSDRYSGGIISKTPVTPAGPYKNSAASGIWTLEQQAYWAAQSLWPTAGNQAPPSAGSEVVFNSATISGGPAIAYDSNAQKVVIAFLTGSTSSAIVGTVSGTSISFGTPATFFSGSAQYISIAYDSNAQKVVIAFRDPASNTFRGKAVVGTVSGTSISFGSVATFTTSATDFESIAYNASAQKVVIVYRNRDSFTGQAIVGSISGTSISFGSAATFNSGNIQFSTVSYDAASGNVVIAYADQTNSQYGTAIVGSVSGTSISFGSKVVFVSSAVYETYGVYDENSQKTVIFYSGTAVVGSVSGTSISFGTPVVYDSNGGGPSASYDSSAQELLIAYTDYGNSQYGTAITGTVSGTSISFGAKSVFNSGTTDSIYTAYDSANQKVVTSFRDVSNSNYGVSCVITTKP